MLRIVCSNEYDVRDINIYTNYVNIKDQSYSAYIYF